MSVLTLLYEAVCTNLLACFSLFSQKHDSSVDQFAWKDQIASRSGMLV